MVIFEFTFGLTPKCTEEMRDSLTLAGKRRADVPEREYIGRRIVKSTIDLIDSFGEKLNCAPVNARKNAKVKLLSFFF